MAAKKRAKVLISSGSLFSDAATAPTEPAPAPDAAPDVVEVPKLRLIHTIETPEEDVVIEPSGDGRFIVSLLRDHGTTCAAVTYTRGQLRMLLRRIEPALEVG